MIARKFAVLVLALALILSACSAAPSRTSNEGAAPNQAPSQPQAPAEEAAGGSGVSSDYSGQVPAPRRLVVTNATISLAVTNPSASLDKIAQMAADMGGWVVSSKVYKTNLDSGQETTHGSITIRVPAERLNEALTQIRGESKEEPISQNTDSQDVTKDYTDLASRLTNLEAAEKQLQSIMESTTNPENVLSVYRELTGVREQIEVIKGEMRYYEESAAMSSIAVELYSEEAVQPITIGKWAPVGVARDAVQALLNTSKFFASAGIWIVIYVVPVLIMILLPVWIIITIIRRLTRRGRPKAQPPAVSDVLNK